MLCAGGFALELASLSWSFWTVLIGSLLTLFSQRSTNSTGRVLFLASGHKKAACETTILANPGLTSWRIGCIPLWAFCSCTDFLGWECANDNNNLFWRCAKFLELNCEVFWIPLEGTGSWEPQRNWRSATTWSSNLIVIEGDCPGLARGPWMASSKMTGCLCGVLSWGPYGRGFFSGCARS